MNSHLLDPIPHAQNEEKSKNGEYKVGTLSYTLPGLIIMMLWLLG